MISRNFRAPIILGINSILFLICIIATYPGWLSDDSLMMFEEARSKKFTNWHSPILNWMWSFFNPEVFGPLIPFFVQQSFIWAGVALVSLTLSQSLGIKSIFLPVLAFSLDSFWIGAWIWKDSAGAAVVSLSIGLISLLEYKKDQKTRLIILMSSIFLINVLIAVRWYLAPITLLASLTFVLYFQSTSQRNGIGQNGLHYGLHKLWSIATLTIVVSVGIYLVLQQQVIKPISKNHGSAVLIQDILTVDCDEKMKPYSGETRIPKSLIQVGTGSLCDYFTVSNLGSMFEAPPGDVRVTSLTTSDQDAELRKIWIESLQLNSKAIVKGKVKLFLGALFDTNSRIPNLKQIEFYENNSAGPIFGSGDKVGWRFNLGTTYKLSKLSSEVVHRLIIESGFLYAVGIPCCSFMALLWRKRKVELWMLTGALLPILFIFEFSVISAWAYDIPRYLAPISIWSLLFATLILISNEHKTNMK